jgi:raffinose/stachyose/melibiose transport system permease protein
MRMGADGIGDQPLRFWPDFRKHTFVWLGGIAAPLAVFVTFAGYPILYNLLLGFTTWNGLSREIKLIGLHNYIELARDPIFILSLLNSLKWTLLTLAFSVGLGFSLATVFFLERVYFPSLYRSLIVLPVTVSLVAVGIMFSLILSPGFGLLDQSLRVLGLGLAHPWLGDYHTALYVLIGAGIWAYVGVPLMLFHAGLSEIDPELLDAARLDGASDFQIARYIFVPALRPVMVIVAILSVIQSLKTFDLVAIMTQGGPAGATKVLGYFMYMETFWNNRFGYGAAISIVILLLSSGFAWIYLRSVANNALHVSKQ